MKKALTYLAAMVIMMAVSLNTVAHPGHGNDNPLAPGHYVSNPQHALPIVLTLAMAVVVSWILNKRENRANKK